MLLAEGDTSAINTRLTVLAAQAAGLGGLCGQLDSELRVDSPVAEAWTESMLIVRKDFG